MIHVIGEIFSILHETIRCDPSSEQYIYCDPSSERSRRVGSDEMSQHMVSMRIKKSYHQILPLI